MDAPVILSSYVHTFTLKIILCVLPQGMVAAIPLAFIIPAMCYIRLEDGPFLSKKKGPAVILALFGIIVTIFGTITIILKVTKNQSNLCCKIRAESSQKNLLRFRHQCVVNAYENIKHFRNISLFTYKVVKITVGMQFLLLFHWCICIR